MQDELCRGPGDSLPVWHVIEGPLQFGMFRDVLANVVHAFAVDLQALLEFSFGLYLRFAERHLHAAVGIDLSFA